jgi:hypothetical protein
MGMPGWGAPWGIPPAAPLDEPATRAEEVEALKAQADYFQNAMEEIRQRIEELESTGRSGDPDAASKE